MSELYLLGVLGNLNDLGWVIAVLSFLVFIALGFYFYLCSDKIPDKCIKALDKYLDDALKQDKNKDEE